MDDTLKSSLKDAEIARLQASLAHWIDMAAQADVACMRMKSLLIRAADALEDWVESLPLDVATEDKNLITQLRAAAQ